VKLADGRRTAAAAAGAAAGAGSVVENDASDYTCPSSSHLFRSNMDFAHHVRSPLKNMVQQLCPKPLHQYVIMSPLRRHIFVRFLAKWGFSGPSSVKRGRTHIVLR